MLKKPDIPKMVEEFANRMNQYPLVRVEFLDHARCGGDNVSPGACETSGRLIHEDALTYYVATWIFDSETDEHSEVHAVAKTKGCRIHYLVSKPKRSKRKK